LANPLRYGNAKTGAVASESSVCSNIGADVLKEGGNAADAVSFDSINP
jgi:gamma-glutamyltranspeptidase/glutathione hydrolase